MCVAASADVVVTPANAPLRTVGGPIEDGAWNLWSNGRVGQYLRIQRDGDYDIVVRAAGSRAAGVWPEMALLVDGLPLAEKTVPKGEMADYRFQVKLAAGVHEIAVAFLNDQFADGEDRNLYLQKITVAPPPGMADPTIVAPEEWAEVCRRREEAMLQKCDDLIERNRKSAAVVRVVDASGKPVAGATVSIEQISADFLFGCNIYMFGQFKNAALDAEYKRRFEKLFNYATTAFYWRYYERRRGMPDYARTDKIVEWCRQRGIQIKGHPLLWGNEAGVPVWSDGQPSADMQRHRIGEIMGRYRDKIHFWEVVNEPTLHELPKIDEPYRWARKAEPTACLIVNEAHVMADGRPLFLGLLRDAIANGVPFDAVGIQAHEPAGMWFPLDRVWQVLNRYAALGKELHITEFTPTSGGEPIGGSYRQGVWNETVQADYAELFYRVCFAHPAVRAITWWDLCERGAWRPGGGLLRADMTPKPVYDRLDRLINHQWQTNLDDQKTDAAGRFEFRGFHGRYRVTVQTDGRKTERRFHLDQTGKNIWTVEL